MKPLIDLFWMRYTQLHHAVSQGEMLLIGVIEREIDPLLNAIYGGKANTLADASLQFNFILDLLCKEADDASNVMRHSETLRRLASLYFVEPETAASTAREQGEAVVTTMIRRKSGMDEGFLNEAILDSLPDHVSVVTPDYRYLYVNAHYAARLEKRPVHLVGRHVAEFVGIAEFEGRLKPNLDACFAGATVDYTYAQEMDGRTIVLRCRLSPCRSGTGKIMGAIVIVQEIADRRRAIAA